MSEIKLIEAKYISEKDHAHFPSRLADMLKKHRLSMSRNEHFEARYFLSPDSILGRYKQFEDPEHSDEGYVIVHSTSRGETPVGIASKVHIPIYEKRNLASRRTSLGEFTLLSAFVIGGFDETTAVYSELMQTCSNDVGIAVVEPQSSSPIVAGAIHVAVGNEPKDIDLVVGQQRIPKPSLLYKA